MKKKTEVVFYGAFLLLCIIIYYIGIIARQLLLK